MLEKSVLVVAHPDDEILFFSSILEKVDAIVFCFLNCPSRPEWGEGRKKSLDEYPFKNISCLGLEESETFFGVNWLNPSETDYGLIISDPKISDSIYKENYLHLTEKLDLKLKDYDNVITHNPWGEYGHSEHVQVFKAIQKLQDAKSFNIWYSNYCSNKSSSLMLRYISGFQSDYLTLKTNRQLGSEIKKIYQKNQCWTWYDDWDWFLEEAFLRASDLPQEKKEYGHFFPLNLIKVEMDSFFREENRSRGIRSLISNIIPKKRQVKSEKID
jgi:hypothetical protein